MKYKKLQEDRTLVRVGPDDQDEDELSQRTYNPQNDLLTPQG